ncbi:uncharacterized protein LDX57_009505 [Aspergillus melleus]|uniref:uncharacterized protein n=1 Tax=Aspergillus melleus TaxID=138277 RepID=UPI001E8EA99E|nr:uncharacterized protein LDX57_009505 [Aspergillus melleus]KAH8431854.1 hypothetical protein LDX57_009505 [Aspergillus melleus]
MGTCGLSGAPFKVTCVRYGYTVVGKGTTCFLWRQLEREADVYRMLSPVQGSAVPVFLGKINMQKIYRLHGAGKIWHMLLMGWGGDTIDTVKTDIRTENRSIARAKKEIESLGVLHQDLASRNVLWNEELDRAMIIDFHLCEFDLHRVKKKPKWLVEKDSGLALAEAEDNDETLRHCPYHGTCIHRLVRSCPNEMYGI